MAEFQEQVMGLTGLTIDASSTSPSRAEFTTFLTDGAKEIINVLPRKLKEKCMTETTLTNSSQTLDLDAVGEILHVTRLSADSGGNRYPCREIPSMYGDLSGNSSNMMYYGTATDPVYWISSSNDATILTVNPTPDDNQTGIVYHVGYPTVAYNDAAIANFPDEAEYLVVLYAACKALQSTMGGKSASLPTLSLPSVPTVPVMSEKSVTITGTAPTFTPPVMNPPDYSDTENWITTEEDSEMLESRVKVIEVQISEYEAKTKEALLKFNEEAEEYKAKLQKDLQDAQLAESKEGRDLQKYSQELASYQAEVQSNVQEFTSNIQKLSTDYQWLQSQYAQLKQDYTQGLQMLIGGGQPQQKQREGER